MNYILLKKDNEDYSTLENKMFIFDRVTSAPVESDFNEAMSRMARVFDFATKGDRIVFNGPSWLIGLAGYIWLSAENRENLGILTYNNNLRQYQEHCYNY